MSDKVEAMHRAVTNHLFEMQKIFVQPVHLTFIARFPNDPEGKCDVLISSDDLEELAKLIERSKGRGPL